MEIPPTAEQPTKVGVFIDFVCPFCFLAEPAIEQLKAKRNVEIDVLPFELRPNPVPTLLPEDEYLPSIWGRAVYPMARRLGIDITLPPVSPQPRTEKAFLGLQVAAEHDLAEQYSHTIFAAFFQQGLDIGLDSVILDAAESVGLSRDEIAEALTDEQRRAKHQEALRWALGTLGVTAVPSFLIGDDLVSGVTDTDRLVMAVDVLGGKATHD